MYCGGDELLEVEHIYPKSLGGSSDLENLTTACSKCNQQKGNLSMHAFLEKIILKRKDIHRIMKVLEVLERRGGITIVDDQDTLITTYFNDSFNRKLKSNSDFNFI